MVEFNICEHPCCSASIEDMTHLVNGYTDSKSYLPDNNPFLGYRESDCVAIYTLTHMKSDGYEVIHSHIVEDPALDMDVKFPIDGYFKITKLLIPNQNILYTNFIDLDSEGNRVWKHYGNTLYFYDTYRKQVYKLIKDDVHITLTGTLLYFDGKKDNEFKHTDNKDKIIGLVIDIECKDLIEDTMLTDLEYKYLKKTETGYVLCDNENDADGYLYDIDDLEYDWIYQNVCIRHNGEKEKEVPDYPIVEGYHYELVCDLIEVLEQCDGSITTQRATKDIFVLCHFRQCVYNTLAKYVKNCPARCNPTESEADIIWLHSSLMALEYIISTGNYSEAQMLLEQLSVCGGPCIEVKINNKKGCGCGKR